MNRAGCWRNRETEFEIGGYDDEENDIADHHDDDHVVHAEYASQRKVLKGSQIFRACPLAVGNDVGKPSVYVHKAHCRDDRKYLSF